MTVKITQQMPTPLRRGKIPAACHLRAASDRRAVSHPRVADHPRAGSHLRADCQLQAASHLRVACLVLLLATALAPSLVSRAVAAVGGTDVRIREEQWDMDVLAGGSAATVAIDSVGTIFTAAQTESLGLALIDVLRSTNGGNTWKFWGRLGSVAGVHTAESPSIAIMPRPFGNGVPPDATELLAVAYVYFDSGAGGYQVRVSVAPTTEDTPTWTDYAAVPGVAARDPKIATRRTPQGALRYYVVYRDPFNNPSGSELRFVRKHGSSTFTSPSPIYTGSVSSVLSHDLAIEARGDTVHVSLVDYDQNTDIGEVYYTRSYNDGTNWSTPVNLSSNHSTFAPLTSIAASPITDEVAIATDITPSSNPAVSVLYSSDKGVTWITRPNLPGRRSPDLAWSPGRLGMATITLPARENGSLLRAVLPGVTSWEADPMIQEGTVAEISGLTPSPLAIAGNPRFGGLFVMVGLMVGGCGFDGPIELWSDGQWRTGVGYLTQQYQVDGIASFVPPAIGDLDNDGFDDIVAVNPFTIYWLDVQAKVLTEWSTADEPRSAPVVGDIDGDGFLEIFTADSHSGRILGYDNTGTPLPGWPVQVAGFDETGDVYMSLVVQSGVITDIIACFQHEVWAFAPNGSVRQGFPVVGSATSGSAMGPVAVGDVDADGDPELVVALPKVIVILNLQGQLEQVLYQADPNGTEDVQAEVTLADLDADLDLEIAFVAGGDVHLVHHDGTPFGPAWPLDPGFVGGDEPVVIADSDNDGEPELHVFAAYEALSIDLDGTVHSRWPEGTPQLVLDEPLVAKLGPPGFDFVALSHASDGTLEAWDGLHFDHEPGYPFRPCDGWGYILIGNFDDDPESELASVGSTTRIFDTGVAYDPDAIDWPMPNHDSAHTSCTGCPTFDPSAVDDDLPVDNALGASTVLGAPWPNPARDGSTLRFRLHDAGRTRLDVYDLAGRRVRVIPGGPFAAGEHEMRWGGVDDAGHRVAPGVYFLRLALGEGSMSHVESRKVTLVGDAGR